MKLKTILPWAVGIIMTITTAYIVWDVFNTITNPPPIDWRNVTDVGGPLPISPVSILTIIDIVLIAFLIRYLCSPEIVE